MLFRSEDHKIQMNKNRETMEALITLSQISDYDLKYPTEIII